MSAQRLTVLGSTGSVGASTLDVVSRHPQRYRVHALTAARNVQVLFEQCLAHRPAFAVMTDAACARELADRLERVGSSTRVQAGFAALEEVVRDPQVDTVMAAIVGAAGLAPCLAAAHAGKRLLLANKEALVVGAELFIDTVRQGNATLLPIDSEHSAIFQCLPPDTGCWPQVVDRLILTSSGGPFRQRDPLSLKDVSPDEACAHPNWVMGRKISVDSATMMNKALEVIEARYLFGMAPEHIQVVIHPQSVVHSMVEFRDGSVMAQLGTPDMRVPIACGLAWPDRIESGASRLDLSRLGGLTFESADDPAHRERFPGLALAWQCLRAPAGTTVVLNAANEVAVTAFLDGRLGFRDIHAVNESALARVPVSRPRNLPEILDLDASARRAAEAEVIRRAR